MEYADNGDLLQKIQNHQKAETYFKEEEIWKVLIGVVRGLHSLHEFDIMHRDIKSANVFLNQDLTAKLGDMNVSKIAQMGLNYTQTGTPYYASPEVWQEKPYDIKSDVWSLGCVLYEMIALHPPFRAASMKDLYSKVLKGKYKPIPEFYSRELGVVVGKLLQVNPTARPTTEEILDLGIVKMKGKFDSNEHEQSSALLQTIMIPQKLQDIGKNLPREQYSDEEDEYADEEFASNKSTSPREEKIIQTKSKIEQQKPRIDAIESRLKLLTHKKRKKNNSQTGILQKPPSNKQISAQSSKRTLKEQKIKEMAKKLTPINSYQERNSSQHSHNPIKKKKHFSRKQSQNNSYIAQQSSGRKLTKETRHHPRDVSLTYDDKS